MANGELTAAKPLTSKVKGGAVGGIVASVGTLALGYVLPQLGVAVDPQLQNILMALFTLAGSGTGSWFTPSKRSDYIQTSGQQ